MHTHLSMLLDALAQAGGWERDELERLAALPLPERIAAGVSWPVLQIEDAAWTGRDRTMVTLRAPRGILLHEGIGPGDRIDMVLSDRTLDGKIRDAAETWAEVEVFGDAPEQGRAELTRRFDPTPWRRQADAIARADGHRSALRDVLLGERSPSPALAHGPSHVDLDLNASQQRAALDALGAGEVALIHGPPGTGKTHVLVALLQALVHDGDRPWALADSNAAVDHLAARAAARGLDVVRVGRWGRMNARGRELSLQRRVENGPFWKAIQALDKEIGRLGPPVDRDSREAARHLHAERRALREQAENSALESAKVIATTLGTLAWRADHLPAPHTAVVDEATQALEPAIWAAVPRIQRLVLVGDPYQLGPVVQRPGSPLERSLLERLIDHDDLDVALPMPMLDVQHRMNQQIQDLVQDVYGDTYTAHPSVASHLLRDLPGVSETDLTGRATLWIDTAGGGLDEAIDPTVRSYYNEGEARLVAEVVRQLRAAGVQPDSIGVIAPYAAQVRRLRDEPDLAGVEVASVNAFQGREKEAIVCSWVRSNHDGELGFVADGRRLTVALSRARRLIVCIGDSATLASTPRFATLLDTLAEQGALTSVWEPPWLGVSDG